MSKGYVLFIEGNYRITYPRLEENESTALTRIMLLDANETLKRIYSLDEDGNVTEYEAYFDG